jgi:hypothetical protein
MGDTLAEIIVGNLVADEWRHLHQSLQGGNANEQQRLRFIQASQGALVARAAALRGLAARVLEQSSPDAVAAADSRAQEIAQAAVDAFTSSPHALRMAEMASEQAAAERLRIAEAYLEQRRTALAYAERQAASNPGAVDAESAFRLERLRSQVAEAQAAVDAIRARPDMNTAMRPADAPTPSGQPRAGQGNGGINLAKPMPGKSTPAPSDGTNATGGKGQRPVGYDRRFNT